MESRCYVVYGHAFDPLKIRGLTNKKLLMESLKEKGFKPKSSQLNPNSPSGRECKEHATPY